MDIRKIKKLIELLEESGVAEIEIREGEESVRIARQAPAGAAAAAPVVSYAQAPAPTSPSAAARAASAAPAAEASTAARASAEGEQVVTAPMVGTFYVAPSPGAKPFVDIGDEVQQGQVLCTIEAMKMMNQIESEFAGRVRAVLAKNGDPVEFGQPLFVIE
jgi:acetyl-CoA carboxylase biotin carboxyl carrier protein